MQISHQVQIRRPSFVVRTLQQQIRFFQPRSQISHEAGGGCAIDHTVISGKRDLHRWANHQATITGHWCINDTANRKNGALWRIDDSGKAVDAKHSQVRNGKRAAPQFLGREFALAGAFGCVAQGSGKRGNVHSMRIADDRH